MIHLDTLVLAAHGGDIQPVGRFLHLPDWPAWRDTIDVYGDAAPIKGATVVDAEELGKQAMCLVVSGRERAPLIADEDCRVWSLEREGWTALKDLGVGETLRIPDITRGGTTVTWAKVHRIMRASLPERLFFDANKMWGRLVLNRGSYSFASPACFVHQ
jgi:hypothetical protein